MINISDCLTQEAKNEVARITSDFAADFQSQGAHEEAGHWSALSIAMNVNFVNADILWYEERLKKEIEASENMPKALLDALTKTAGKGARDAMLVIHAEQKKLLKLLQPMFDKVRAESGS